MKRCYIFILTGFFLVCSTSFTEAKTFYVTTTDDSFAYDGHCSLREAIVSANGATLIDAACGLGDPGEDIILLEPGDYYLMTPENGDDGLSTDLDIYSEIIISAYVGNVSIRQQVDVNGDVNGRVFEIHASGVLTIRNLTIFGGEESLLNGGGGIKNSGLLILDHVTVTGNTGYSGGGIQNISGSTLHLYDSTISGNTATGDSGGGGLSALDAHVYIHRSTISDNETYGSGGGIFADFNAYVSMVNSTISGNNARVSGGGIYNDSGNISLSNVTVTANTANSDDTPDNDGYGGGIVNTNGGGGNINLWNTMSAGNVHLFTGWGIPNIDCAGDLTSQGYNLVGQIGVTCTLIDTGAGPDQIGGTGSAIDPLIGALADNSGATNTHALLIGSPAIDMGNPSGCLDGGGSYISDDQRERVRPSGLTCDVGSYEYGYNASLYTVTVATDDSAGCTLREALESIMSGTPASGCTDSGATGVDTIIFDPAVTGTIALNADLPTVDQSIHIIGPGSSILTVDGQGSFRSGLNIDSPGNIATVVIEGLTFSGGFKATYGSAMVVADGEALELTDVVVTNNESVGGNVNIDGHAIVTTSTISNNVGPGIYVGNGSLQMTDSTVSGNSGSSGGGIRSENSAVTIAGCTFNSNTSTYLAGALYISNTNSEPVIIENCTFTGNSAPSEGGGAIFVRSSNSGPVTIKKCTFSGNTAEYSGAIHFYSGLISIEDSVIHGNHATNGDGGGIGTYTWTSVDPLKVSIANTTISSNTTTVTGGGIYLGSSLTDVVSFRLANVTISGNSADIYGGGVGIHSDGRMWLRNSIIAGNQSLNLFPNLVGCNYVISEDYNLIGDVSENCDPGTWATNDITNADPLLGALANYGGQTKTHQLLTGSPAIDGGNPFDGCTWDHDSDPVTPDVMLNTDQRSWNRYFDGDDDTYSICDIGAFEFDGTVIAEETIFDDGFETGDLSMWSSSVGF